MHIAGRPSATDRGGDLDDRVVGPGAAQAERHCDAERPEHREDEDRDQRPRISRVAPAYPVGQADDDREEDHGREQFAQRHDDVVQEAPAPSPAA